MLLIGIFVFITVAFAWALSPADIKELEDRFK